VTPAHRRLAFALLLASLLAAAGPTECAAPLAQPAEVAPPPSPASLKLTPLPSYPAGGTAWYAILTLQATVGAPLQAYDVDVYFTPGVASLATATPHAGFSEDNALAAAGTPNTGLGVLSQIVDLRHGPGSALTGSPNLFYLVIRVTSRVPLWVQASGELARGDGKLFATTPSARVRVLPPP
jgi:hypothetical protein